MRSIGALLAFILLAGIPVRAQRLNEYLNTSHAAAQVKEQAHHEVAQLAASFSSDSEPDLPLLRKVFRKVHNTVLKQYEPYADFSSLFTDGKYDCLTATTLFSYLLSDLGFDFKLVETNYHIFILVQSRHGEVLLETTDRIGGIITDPGEIAQRIGKYRLNELRVGVSENNYQYQCKLYREVGVDGLTGLLYFNQAVKSYNQGDWLACAKYLEQAHARYATDRSAELGDILVQTLLERKEIATELRNACLVHLKAIILNRSGAVAAN